MPKEVTFDTTEATASAEDPTDQACWGGQLGATAWVSYTPESTRTIVVDYSTQNYEAALNIFAVQADGSLNYVSGACYSNTFTLDVQAGTTYLFMAAACCDQTGTGGPTTIGLRELPAPPEIGIAFTSGSVNQKTGTAYLTGTVTCDRDTDIGISGSLRQRVKGTVAIVSQDFYTWTECRNGTGTWTVQVRANGAFTTGSAELWVSAGTCGEFECVETQWTRTIRLKPTRA